MKKLLFIGHAFHNKTKSSQFFQDLLASEYDVEKFDFDPYSDSPELFAKLRGRHYDVVVLWQILPHIRVLKKYITWDRIAFCPMYDSFPKFTDTIWFGYRKCNIINFSKALHKKCVEYGFSSFYIQYFPAPAEVMDWGDTESIFLWQRTRYITADTLEQIVDTNAVKHLYFHAVPDPEHQITEPSDKWRGKVTRSTWFDSKDDLVRHIQKSAIYIAPRRYEGIGMSFLDAMATGRCVIAVDEPTMNEYITNGENGYLYSLDNPQEIDIRDVRRIQKNTYEYIKQGHKQWEREKNKVFEWLQTDPLENADIEKLNRFYRFKLIKPAIKHLIKNTFSVTKIKPDQDEYRALILFGLRIKLRKIS